MGSGAVGVVEAAIIVIHLETRASTTVLDALRLNHLLSEENTKGFKNVDV
jgi:hypothetical protein